MDYHEQLREAWRRESEYWQTVLPKYDESYERVYSISVWGGVLAALSLIGAGLLNYYPMPWLAFAVLIVVGVVAGFIVWRILATELMELIILAFLAHPVVMTSIVIAGVGFFYWLRSYHA